MTIEHQRPTGRSEQEHIVPVSYILDGVFLTPDRRVLVRHVPENEEFSPKTIDLPSMQLDRVSSPREMRHAVMTMMRANIGLTPTSCVEYPFMANRTIAPNNGSYRDTRRIFYRGTINQTAALPSNYYLIDTDMISRKDNWRRRTIFGAITFARNLADDSSPHGLIITSDNEGALSPTATAQSQRHVWNLTEQLQEATQLEEMVLKTMRKLR